MRLCMRRVKVNRAALMIFCIASITAAAGAAAADGFLKIGSFEEVTLACCYLDRVLEGEKTRFGGQREKAHPSSAEGRPTEKEFWKIF